ncbi:YbdD/YjiX family protein [Sphingomonas phyllosphaerae]|uniref:YbdD/YjiX family protein n=1 Tax=Sphingomonas phyllosphaerae TaxID=257003 RepID=UPI00241301B0|nr:YbdD/YjiX family protein [Sphingomonas phyllosphaerae]
MTALWRRLAQTARLMVGQPDYDAYRRHLAEHHPEREAMTRVQFFREREAARYRGGGGRCC